MSLTYRGSREIESGFPTVLPYFPGAQGNRDPTESMKHMLDRAGDQQACHMQVETRHMRKVDDFLLE